MVKRILKERPYCSNTLTEAGLFGMIRSVLRRISIRWKPRIEVLNAARRLKINGGRSKYEYHCSICLKWFIRAHVEVDHIYPCGSIKCFNDIGPFVQRLLCEKEGFRVLCIKCHLLHTNKGRNIK